MNKEGEKIYEDVAVNLLTTHSWYMHKLKSVLRPYGISPEQYNVLRIIKGANQRPVSASYIKERMIDKGSNITRMVDKMEAKKWVTRSLCETNRRQMDIDITEEGIGVVSNVTSEVNELIKVFYALTEEEAELLSQLLKKARL